MKRLALLSPCQLAGALFAQAANAESLVDGVYRSPGDANGNGQCTLVIKSVDGGEEEFQVNGGFLSVANNRVSILGEASAL